MLWANIVASYNPECLRDCENKGPNGECRCAAKMKVHAETSTFNLTLFDAHVNLLRTQTEAMSAALGGVDSMTVVILTRPMKLRMSFPNVWPVTSNCC